MNKRITENYILKFLTVSSVSSDSIVKGIIDDIINTAVKTAEVDEQNAKYLQHFINKHMDVYTALINMTQSCQIKQRYTFHLHHAFIE